MLRPPPRSNHIAGSSGFDLRPAADPAAGAPDPSDADRRRFAMEEALELARAKDTKERMAGVERLHQLLEASRKGLSAAEATSLVDCCLDLLRDNNFRVSQGALQALASAAVLSGEHLKLHFNALVPAAVERLGDGKQPVRDAARRLLLTLMEVIRVDAQSHVLVRGPLH